MAIERFAVLGAGAIGGYVGAALARAGRDVTLIARGAHLAAMRTNGVHVRSERGDFHADVKATDEAGAHGPFDCIIVSLKGHQLVDMLPAIRRMSHARTQIVPMQNGIPWWYFQDHGGPLEGTSLETVDPGGKLAAAFDPANVVGCVIYCSTEIEAPGVIRHIEGTRFALGRPSGAVDAEIQEISAALTEGGLKAPIETDLRSQIWLKILGNAALNPISALTRATIAGMLRDRKIEQLVRDIMTECAAVATGLGVELPVSIEKRIDGAVASASTRHRCSKTWSRTAARARLHHRCRVRDRRPARRSDAGDVSGARAHAPPRHSIHVETSRPLEAPRRAA